jgi:hypothetical protein
MLTFYNQLQDQLSQATAEVTNHAKTIQGKQAELAKWQKMFV